MASITTTMRYKTHDGETALTAKPTWSLGTRHFTHQHHSCSPENLFNFKTTQYDAIQRQHREKWHGNARAGLPLISSSNTNQPPSPHSRVRRHRALERQSLKSPATTSGELPGACSVRQLNSIDSFRRGAFFSAGRDAHKHT
jgi:hypothetical protein